MAEVRSIGPGRLVRLDEDGRPAGDPVPLTAGTLTSLTTVPSAEELAEAWDSFRTIVDGASRAMGEMTFTMASSARGMRQLVRVLGGHGIDMHHRRWRWHKARVPAATPSRKRKHGRTTRTAR